MCDRTLRAGTLSNDTYLSRGSQPLVRTESLSGLSESSKRVTPWLFRQVNAPGSPTSQTPSPSHPEEAPANVMRSTKPPSYPPAQESSPSKETSADTAQEIEIAAKDSRAGTHLPQSPPRAPIGLPWPNRPNRSAGPSDSAPNLRQAGLCSDVEEERPRPGIAIRHGTAAPAPARPPRHRPREMSFTPSLSSYSVSGGSSATSTEPWPQDRSSTTSSVGSCLALPGSAVSRIRAAYKVSNELGNAVTLQELRVATPVPDAASTPRVTRRFVSITEPEGFRKVYARVDRRSGSREARQRVLSKPSDYGGRSHDGKIHRPASERVNPMGVRDVSRRQARRLVEGVMS